MNEQIDIFGNLQKPKPVSFIPKKATNGHREFTPPVFIGQNLYIKPTYIVSMPEYTRDGGNLRSFDARANEANLEDNKQNGKLSRKAISGLKNSINWLCISAKPKRVFMRGAQKEFKFKVNFITLTLPDTEKPISSKELQTELLNPFLTYMRKYQNLKNYVWRLEFQANGKLHVHLTTDTFIHHRILRDTWNRLLHSRGHLGLFYEKNKHLDPNSTDVHATKKVKNMAAYLAKYMGKQGQGYKYQPAALDEKIQACMLVGVSEKQIANLVEKKKKALEKKPRPLGAMEWKRWYFQRVNFWNSPFNPRPITGRIWGCSKELSRANKLTVHVPANECSQDLRSLQQPGIKWQEILVQIPKKINSVFSGSEPETESRKIGTVYFLTAVDWFQKISGPVRRAFEETRQKIFSLTENLTFELT